MKEIHLLKTKWTVWQNYKTNKQINPTTFQAIPVLTFKSLNQFKKVWNQTPLKSLYNYFLDVSNIKVPVHISYQINNQLSQVNTISFFREKIQPMWECPGNKDGISMSLVTTNPQLKLIKVYQEIVFNIINQNFPFSEYICGVRFIDKYINLKDYNAKLKIDFWLNKAAKQNATEVQKQIKQAIASMGITDKVKSKPHQQSIQGQSK